MSILFYWSTAKWQKKKPLHKRWWYRLSFLYGSYLTLTNLKKEDWERIAMQKLSPLFISVHATDPAIREKLLKNKKADVNLGINFKDALFDSIKQCNNRCPFCFIDQQPSGKRKSLYIKDDDID